MADLLNIVWGYGPFVLSLVALLVAVEALRAAHAARGHACELEALISRHRQAQANAAARLRSPEVG
jgi:hypothetical protein